jgi:hypothetical protein
MNFSFHVDFLLNLLTLARFEARVGLANNVDASLATNDLAVRVTVLERFK